MELQDITLYHFPLTRSVRVIWMLEEMGLDYKLVKVDVFAGEAFTEVSERVMKDVIPLTDVTAKEFAKLNPNHALPVLQFKDGRGEQHTMFESSGIVSFLGQLSPAVERKLVPTLSSSSIEQVSSVSEA